jgi:predicted lactoylglutathione lyase
MKIDFPAAVPEVPVSSIDEACAYYVDRLGFTLDWGDDIGGIAGISKGDCRIFLTNAPFRQPQGNSAPVVIWINLGNRSEVNNLHRLWSGNGAKVASPPESKPWKLYEFTAADPDGNQLRVFYDFAFETAEVP